MKAARRWRGPSPGHSLRMIVFAGSRRRYTRGRTLPRAVMGGSERAEPGAEFITPDQQTSGCILQHLRTAFDGHIGADNPLHGRRIAGIGPVLFGLTLFLP